MQLNLEAPGILTLFSCRYTFLLLLRTIKKQSGRAGVVALPIKKAAGQALLLYPAGSREPLEKLMGKELFIAVMVRLKIEVPAFWAEII